MGTYDCPSCGIKLTPNKGISRANLLVTTVLALICAYFVFNTPSISPLLSIPVSFIFVLAIGMFIQKIEVAKHKLPSF